MQARPMPHLVKKNGVVTHFSLHRPEDVLPGVHSLEDTQAALDYYAHPFIDNALPQGKHARRWHVTRVRPALRWFCKKYEIEQPTWLKGNGIYDNMTEEERTAHYGQPELLVNDFDDEDAPPEDHEDPDQKPPPVASKKPKKKGAKKKGDGKKDAKKKPAKKKEAK